MSNSYYIENLLELRGFFITNCINSDELIKIHVELPFRVHSCSCCLTSTSKVHDYCIQSIKEIPRKL